MELGMQKSKFKTLSQKFRIVQVFAGLLTAALFLLSTAPGLAHFVKSDSGIGAVLHIDPGDDPIAGSQSTIFLEFKDVNNKLKLSECICRIIISETGKEVLNQSFEGAGGTESLSAVIPVVFPDLNVYKMTVEGTPKFNNGFAPFKLEYDIRVAQGSSVKPVKTEESSWLSGHIIHLVGGGILLAFLMGALISQNKKKVAVIIIVLLVLAHSIPIKAIHAAHNVALNQQAFACCLSQAALIPELPEVFEPLFIDKSENIKEGVVTRIELNNLYPSRSPPFI